MTILFFLALVHAAPVLVPQTGHSATVSALAFSPDAALVATADEAGAIRIWERSSGRLIRILKGHSGSVGALLFTPDGRSIVSAGSDRRVLRWWIETGKIEARVSVRTEVCPAIALSSDGKTLATASGNRIQLRSAATGKVARSLEGHTSPVARIAYSPDGRRLASVSDQGRILVHEVATGAVLMASDEGSEVALALGFSADGRQILTSHEADLAVRDAATGEIIARPKAPLIHTFSRDGKLGVQIRTDWADDKDFIGHEVVVWDLLTVRVMRRFRAHFQEAASAAFSADGTLLASGGSARRAVNDLDDFHVHLWDIAANRRVSTLAAHDVYTGVVAVSGDAQTMAEAVEHPKEWDESESEEEKELHMIRITDATTGRTLCELDGQTAAFLPGTRSVVTGSYKGIAQWDYVTGKRLRLFSIEKEEDLSISPAFLGNFAVSPRGDKVAVYTQMERMEIWSTASTSGRAEKPVVVDWSDVSGLAVYAAAFSPDGKTIACGLSGDGENRIEIRDVATGKRIARFSCGAKGAYSAIRKLVFSSDGMRLACSLDNGFELFELPAGRKIWSMKTRGDFRSAAFSADGGVIAAAGNWDDPVIRLFDAATGKKRFQLEGHEERVNVVRYLPNGSLVSGGADGVLRFWNLEQKKESLAFHRLPDEHWLLRTPENYYDASPDADRHFFFRVDAELFEVAQYRGRLHRPDFVHRRLAEILGLPVADDVRPGLPVAASEAVPTVKVRILSPQDGAAISGSEARLKIVAEDRADSIRAIHVFVNGAALDGERGVAVSRSRETARKIEWSRSVPLLPGQENEIAVWAENASGFSSRRRTVRVTARGDSAVARPVAYVLAVGVSDYAEDKLDLLYADKDAQAVAQFFEKQSGFAYEEVRVLLLTNSRATRKEIEAALAGFFSEARPQDVVVILFAGHTARAEGGAYYFLPHDAPLKSPSDGISYQSLRERLGAIPAQRRLLLLDSCFAGQIEAWTRTEYSSRIDEMIQATGVYVMMAASPAESARESNDWGHGAFTKAFLEALSGKADTFRDGRITIQEIPGYVSGRVSQLTSGRQTPMISAYRATDYTLAVVR